MDARLSMITDQPVQRRGLVARLHVVLAAAVVLSGGLARTEAVERVSVRSDAKQANSPSGGAATAGDGSCVAFYSDADNLLPQGLSSDTNQARDVFLFDRETKRVQRVSLAADGSQANGPSAVQDFHPALDASCSCVAFSSDATNLVDGDSNQANDVFFRDVVANTTVRVSVAGDEQANGPSSFPSVTDGCGKVAFQSTANNLVSEDLNRVSDIFVYDRDSGETTRVNLAADGSPANGVSITPSISADGRCVAFASAATNLMPGDTNRKWDIYVACDGRVTCRASVDSAGAQANDDSYIPSLSADGRLVAFKSFASNLAPGDFNSAADVFVHDCETGTTELVSLSNRGKTGEDNSFPPAISGDGRFVAFGSFASTLLPGQSTGGQAQVYVRDRLLGRTTLMSSTPSGNPGNGSVPDLPPSISGDGRFVAFSSLAWDLVPNDTNGAMDVFIAQNVIASPPTPTSTETPLPSATPTPMSCVFDQDCPVGQVCEEHLCRTIICDDEHPCPGGRTCSDGTCQPIHPTPSPLPTCITDADCVPPDHCRGMVCVPERPCDNEKPPSDWTNCRAPGERETCVNNTCECGGDCNLDGLVLGNEVGRMVCIVSGECPKPDCLAGDFNGDGQLMGNEVCAAIANLGYGCPGEGLPLETRRDRSGEIRTLEVGTATGVPGQTVTIAVDVTGGGEMATAQMDLLLDTHVLALDDPSDPAKSCVVAPRLASSERSFAFLPQQPGAPAGMARLRIFVADLALCSADVTDLFQEFDAGPLVQCTFRIKPNAPLGTSALTGQRLNVGDNRGNEFGTLLKPGSVTVVEAPACQEDSDCQSGTVCRHNECVPVCSGPTTGPSECRGGREACVDNVCQCAGDCGNDGFIRSQDLIAMNNILRGTDPLSSCRSFDVNGDGQVRSEDVLVVQMNLRDGCP